MAAAFFIGLAGPCPASDTYFSGNWLWGADKATAIFLIGTIAGMTGGEVDVDIPVEALKPYMKLEAPVR